MRDQGQPYTGAGIRAPRKNSDLDLDLDMVLGLDSPRSATGSPTDRPHMFAPKEIDEVQERAGLPCVRGRIWAAHSRWSQFGGVQYYRHASFTLALQKSAASTLKLYVHAAFSVLKTGVRSHRGKGGKTKIGIFRGLETSLRVRGTVEQHVISSSLCKGAAGFAW